jgi:hypothetical protein
MIVYERNSHSHTRSSNYIENFTLFLASCLHIWRQGVVCIKCGSMWGETYTRIPDMYPAGQIRLRL